MNQPIDIVRHIGYSKSVNRSEQSLGESAGKDDARGAVFCACNGVCKCCSGDGEKELSSFNDVTKSCFSPTEIWRFKTADRAFQNGGLSSSTWLILQFGHLVNDGSCSKSWMFLMSKIFSSRYVQAL